MEYLVTQTNGEKWILIADMVQASASIQYDYHQEEGGSSVTSTPFQTADARHRIYDAAALVLHYMDRASCAQDDDDNDCDCADRIASVEEIESVEG